VALVGYTNAGKGTLFNALTHAGAEVSDALFVTLDPLLRQVRLPDGGELLVSDTVVSSIASRMRWWRRSVRRSRGVVEADLVLHVIDVAAADRERRIAAVRQVLEEVGATEVPLIEVYNKCDQLTPESRRLQNPIRKGLCLSALNGPGVDELVETLASRLALDVRRMTLTFDPNDPADRDRIGRLYRHARVVVHETRDGRVSIVADVPRRVTKLLLNRRSQ
jgi:GTP-binding protein HflX